MALVQKPALVTIKMRDRSRPASGEFHVLPVGGNLPSPGELGAPSAIAPFTFVYELYGNFKDVSDCAAVGYSITYTWEEDPLLNFPAAPANPNAERKGVFQFKTTNFGRTSTSVPGININAQGPDGKQLTYNLDPVTQEPTFTGPLAGDLQSIHDKLRNGATIGAVTYPVGSYLGNDINKFDEAFQQTKASKGKG